VRKTTTFVPLPAFNRQSAVGQRCQAALACVIKLLKNIAGVATGMNWSKLFQYRWWVVRIPIYLVFLLLGLLWIQLFWPVSQARLTMSTGGLTGSYHKFGLDYQRVLADRGIALVLKTSEGSPQNLERLQKPRADPDSADLTLAQGGFGVLSTRYDKRSEAPVVTLANVGLEPLWIFSKQREWQRVDQLRSLRVGVGSGQSGSRQILLQLLAIHRVAPQEVNLVTLDGMQLPKALERGDIDVAVHVALPESPVVLALL
jgi:TRAP-type uncharacterized transport system substrate-binding protein